MGYEDTPVDFHWIYYIGMKKLGFSYEELGMIPAGLFYDLTEQFKKQHNFEIKRGLYDLSNYEIGSLDDI